MTRPDMAQLRADRNACIVRDYTHGAMTMQQVAAHYGITKQRVSQIVARTRVVAQIERCERGEHLDRVEYGYDRERPDGTMERVTGFRCSACLNDVKP